MSRSEFDIISEYFSSGGPRRGDVGLGVGDDCALLSVPAGHELAVSIDTMVVGVHFPLATTPYDIGYKAMAVSLSDLAAMGAEPAWATLALTLPHADPEWLGPFAAGLFVLANEHGVQLVGGDTTRGPLTVTTQLHGFVPQGAALRRSGAAPGDAIYVTGRIGDAGLGLKLALGEVACDADTREVCLQRLNRPTPRVAEGISLRGIASAAIDVSDGLGADLGHILEQSGVGASVALESLPLSPWLSAHLDEVGGWAMPLAAGDDYELCFTVPAAREARLHQVCVGHGYPVTRIGVVEAAPGLRVSLQGRSMALDRLGYDHFAQ